MLVKKKMNEYMGFTPGSVSHTQCERHSGKDRQFAGLRISVQFSNIPVVSLLRAGR